MQSALFLPSAPLWFEIDKQSGLDQRSCGKQHPVFTSGFIVQALLCWDVSKQQSQKKEAGKLGKLGGFAGRHFHLGHVW